MRIRVVHETIYTYEQPARGLVQVLRLTPRDHDGQYVRTWRIDTTIDGRLTAREDGFGNVVHWFTPDEPADALTIRVTGEVDTDDTNGVVRGTVERLPDQFFLRDTDLCAASPELHAFAERVAAEGDGAVLALLHRHSPPNPQPLKQPDVLPRFSVSSPPQMLMGGQMGDI